MQILAGRMIISSKNEKYFFNKKKKSTIFYSLFTFFRFRGNY
jgi:hypothetical protein